MELTVEDKKGKVVPIKLDKGDPTVLELKKKYAMEVSLHVRTTTFVRVFPPLFIVVQLAYP